MPPHDAALVVDRQADLFRPVGLDLDRHVLLGVGPGVGVRYRKVAAEFAVAGVIEYVICVGYLKRAQGEPLGAQRDRRM